MIFRDDKKFYFVKQKKKERKSFNRFKFHNSVVKIGLFLLVITNLFALMSSKIKKNNELYLK